MFERRLVGRRYTDLHPEAPIASYPLELERRRKKRREEDREEGRDSLNAVRFRRPLHPILLYTAIWRCRNCGREGKRMRNLPKEGRQYIVSDFALGSLSLSPCSCGHSDWNLDWILQAGRETNPEAE